MNLSNIVNLRWNQHQATLLSDFYDLLGKEKLTDCTISTEGRHLRAHKIILCACSPYFEELFTENNEKDPIIILHDIKYDTIKALVDFMYRGEVNVPQMDLRDVFNLSESLQIRGLSGRGYVDNVSKQNISGINSPPAGPNDLLSQPASLSCFTNHFQSVCSELEATNWEMAVAENQQCLIPEAVLPNKMSTNLSAHQQRVSVETESEYLKNCSVITLNDDGYYDDNVNNVQKISGRNLRSSSEALPSQGISVPCFTRGQNNSEENLQRQWSPTVSPQGGGRVEVDLISKSIRKYRKRMNQSGFDQGRGQHFEEGITCDLDTVHQLQSQKQVLPTVCDSSGGSVYDSIGQMTVSENEQFSMPEAVLTDGRSAPSSAQQQEVTVETKSEINEKNMEIVEDLTLDDDDDYSSSGDYSSVEIDNREASNHNEGLTNEETVHIQGSNNQNSPLGSDYLNNVSLAESQSVLHNQFTCNSCWKSYRYRYNLQRHMKYQCGKEPQFQCPHCRFRCARSDKLKAHMAKHH